jgi:hypothetical protein
MNAVIYICSRLCDSCIEEDLQYCRDYAEEHGYTVVGEFVDKTNMRYDCTGTNYQVMVDSREDLRYHTIIHCNNSGRIFEDFVAIKPRRLFKGFKW